MNEGMAPVGVVVAGYGYWGANLARNVQAADSTTLVGVVDPDQGQRDRAAKLGATTWATLPEALADPAVEAVVLATPAHSHEALALDILRAGRHVLVEKPLAMTTAGARRVAAAGKAAGLTVMVGHTFLYAPPVRRLRQLLDDGELGTVQYLSSQRLSLGRIRKDCNALWNFAPHDVAILCYLLGARPTRVSGTGFSFIQSDIADVCFASLEFPGGEGAHIHVSWLDPRKTRLLTIVGDQKMAIYNDVSVDQKLWIVDAGVAQSESLGEYASMGEFQLKTRAGDIVIPNVPFTEPLLLEMEDFGRSCRTGELPVAHADHGIDVVAVLEAVDTSMAAGGAPVEVAR